MLMNQGTYHLYSTSSIQYSKTLYILYCTDTYAIQLKISSLFLRLFKVS